MTRFRRFTAVLALLLAIALAAAAPPAAADDAPGGEDNTAVAVNTEDGASVFRLAFSVRMVANGVIDEANRAYALASCIDCQTVALAFQVVLVWGDVDIVIPENQAVAYNDQCIECITYASATQFVLGFDGPVRFTAEGRRRLAEWYKALSDLEEQVGELSVVELHAAVSAAKTSLIAILNEELVPVTVAEKTATTTTSTAPGGITTTTDGSPSTTTSEPGASSTTTTTTTSSTSTTSTSSTSSTSSTPTTVTEAPTTTAAG